MKNVPTLSLNDNNLVHVQVGETISVREYVELKLEYERLKAEHEKIISQDEELKEAGRCWLNLHPGIREAILMYAPRVNVIPVW